MTIPDSTPEAAHLAGTEIQSARDLTRQTLTGIGWAALGRAVGQGGAFVLSVVLARLLTPADFGLIAMTTVFTGFASLFVEMGFGAAIVQARSLHDTHLSSVFWLTLCVGSLLTAISILIAPAAASFFSEPDLRATMSVLSLSFVIGSLSVVQRAVLTRNMQFRVLASIDVTAVWISGAAAMAAAFAGLGVWSLVIQSLGGIVCATALQWMRSAWRPNLHFRWASVRELIGFSSNLLGFSVINYWVRNFDNLLIGKVFGSAPLGLYSRAYSLMLLPTAQLVSVFGSVMFPALSRIQDDPQRVKRAYVRSIALIAFVTFPIMLGLAATAKDFVLCVYGERWLPVARLLPILCIVGALQSVGSTVGWIYRSQGRTDALLRWGIVAGGILLASIGVGVLLGSVETVAICYAIASCLLLYPNFSIPGRYIGLTVREVASSLWRPAACAIGMALLVALLHLVLDGWRQAWLRLLIEVCAGMTFYAALSWAINRPAYAEARALITSRVRRTPRG
jgi:PST family polysaccharide transporter